MTDQPMLRASDSPAALRAGDSISTAVLHWEKFLLAAGSARNTVNAFTADLRLLQRYLGGGQTLSEISTKDLQEFLRWMETERGVPCSPKTYARRVTAVKAFFRFATESAGLAEDPAAPIVQRVVQSPLPEVLTEAETRSVLAAARGMRLSDESADPDERPYVLVALLLQTGIKKGECVALRAIHIEIDGPEPYLFVRYSNPRQRFKERKIALTADWVEAYRRYRDGYRLTDRVFPWSARRLEYLLEEIGRKAGLAKHLSFEMCRWTCAVLDRERGMDSDLVRQKLGLSRMQWREVSHKLERLLAGGGESAATGMLYSPFTESSE